MQNTKAAYYELELWRKMKTKRMKKKAMNILRRKKKKKRKVVKYLSVWEVQIPQICTHVLLLWGCQGWGWRLWNEMHLNYKKPPQIAIQLYFWNCHLLSSYLHRLLWHPKRSIPDGVRQRPCRNCIISNVLWDPQMRYVDFSVILLNIVIWLLFH